MMRYLLLFLLISSLSSFSQNRIRTNEKIEVSFKIKNFGVNVDGSFKQTEIETNFSKKDWNVSFIKVKIPVKSITTGIKARDEHLLEEAYFDVEKHPLLSFETTKIEKVSDGNYTIFGNLTIKGKTKALKIPMKLQETKDTITFSANFSLNRRDFDVGGGSLILSKKVNIMVKYQGTKQQ